MSVLYNVKVFEGSISGTTAVYTASELNAVIARADKFFLSLRAAQSSGTTPTVTVDLEHSNDNVNWTTKSTLINAQSLQANALTTLYGSDTGQTVGGAFMRLEITLGGTNPAANLQLFLCGRSSD